MNKVAPAARSKARRFAVQAVYQAQLTDDPLSVVERQFREDHDMKRVDTEYLHDSLQGISSGEPELIELLAPHLGREVDELTHVERAILLLGAWELNARIDIPYRVVINEAIELAQLFGASESYRFVNAALDQLARHVRPAETGTA